MTWLLKLLRKIFPPVKPISEQPEPEEVEDTISCGPSLPLGRFTRIEVIDHAESGAGRALIKKSDAGIYTSVQVQDGQQTLKIFLSDKAN